MIKKSDSTSTIFRFRYIIFSVAVITLLALFMLLDIFSIKGNNLSYSVFIYNEEGIPLPYASQKYEADMGLFMPLLLYKKAHTQTRSFRYLNAAAQENKEWIALKVNAEEAESSVFVVLTDNAFLQSFSVIDSSDTNITYMVDKEAAIMSNTYRKLVLDLSSIEAKAGSFTVYLGMVGDIGYGVNVYKQKAHEYMYLQECVFLLLGLWFGVMLMILARISRVVINLRRRLSAAFAFCVVYVFVYFTILIARSGILQVTSIPLLSVESIVVIFHSVFAFSLFCLFLDEKLGREWYYSGLICLTIFILLSVSGYAFVSEILVNIFNIILFLMLLYNLQHFRFRTSMVRKFALAMIVFVLVFSFLNVSIMLVSRMYSFTYRFVHLGIFISILLMILMSYEQQAHEAGLVEARSAKEDFEAKSSNLEQVYRSRLATIQKLLNKPVSEICMMLDEFRDSIKDENIKGYISVWKMELSKYLSVIPPSSDFDAPAKHDLIPAERLIHFAVKQLQNYGLVCSVKFENRGSRELYVNTDLCQWLIMKAIILLQVSTGVTEIRVKIEAEQKKISIQLDASDNRSIAGSAIDSGVANISDEKTRLDELYAIADYCGVEIAVSCEPNTLRINLGFSETGELQGDIVDDTRDFTVIAEHSVSAENVSVLVVEDEPIVLYAIKRNLEKIGYTVYAVISGLKGLDYLSNLPDISMVLLSDSILDVPWDDFVKKARTIVSKSLPILVVTSSSRQESIDKFFNTGADDFIVKPIVFSELSARVRIHMQMKESLEKQLENQQKIGELDKLKSLAWLTAGIAHEINTPNNAVLREIPIIQKISERFLREMDRINASEGSFSVEGYSYEDIKNEYPQMLNDIYMGAKQIGRIVEDLKRYVRADAIQEMQNINLNNVVNYALRLLNHTIKIGTNKFRCEQDEGIPEIRGDFMKIAQIIVNLVENAIHALPDKEHGITVMTSVKKMDASARVLLVVRDEGTGIKKENLPFIFDPFFTTRRELGGSGLGLPVVYGIAKDHNAEISVDSEEGFGTTVTVSFPEAGKGGTEP